MTRIELLVMGFKFYFSVGFFCFPGHSWNQTKFMFFFFFFFLWLFVDGGNDRDYVSRYNDSAT